MKISLPLPYEISIGKPGGEMPTIELTTTGGSDWCTEHNIGRKEQDNSDRLENGKQAQRPLSG